MRFTTVIKLLVAAYLPWGCTSTDHSKTEDLDVTVGGAPAGKPAGEVESATTASQMSKSPAADWQSFFKGPPSAPERSQLEKKLETWKDEDKPEELLKKARAEVAIGRYGAAEATLRRAIRLSPDDLDANLELSLVYLRKRDIVRTFELLSQVKDIMASSETLKPEFVFRYRYALALSYIERGDRDKGHKILSDLIGIDKGFAPAYASLASSYLEIGKDSVAEFVVRRGLDRVSDHAGLLNLMGVILRRSKQFDSARTWFEKALAADPGFTPALVNRAMISTQNLEYGSAEEDLLQALSRDPNSVDALVALSVVQRRQGNFSGAKAALIKAVDLDPENATARFNLGIIYAEDLKRPNEAVRLFSEVTQTAGASSELKAQARAKLSDLRPDGASY